MTTETNDAYCTCLGCGRLVLLAEMVERVAEAGPYQDVDVDDVEGVKDCRVRTARIEFRCSECMSAPAEKEIVQ